MKKYFMVILPLFIADCRLPIANFQKFNGFQIGNRKSAIGNQSEGRLPHTGGGGSFGERSTGRSFNRRMAS
jgi:hypothetical protein